MIKYDPTKRNNGVDEYITHSTLALFMVNFARKTYIESNETYPLRAKVLDPGANVGVLGNAYKEIDPDALVYGVELMHGIDKPDSYHAWFEGQDFREWQSPTKFDIVIANPPYSNPKRNIAEEFVWKSRSILKPEGIMCYLLRAPFRHSKKRYYEDPYAETGLGLMRKWCPIMVVDLIPRPVFYEQDPREKDHYGTRNSNMHDYSVFIWHNKYNGTNNKGIYIGRSMAWR